jgi:dTDP-4-dehydrorhamnose reductase
LAGLNPSRISPIPSSQFVRPALRPQYSVLGHEAWFAVGLAPMRDWKVALNEAFAVGAMGTT